MELLAFLFVFIVLMAAVLFSFAFNSKSNDGMIIPQLPNCPQGFTPTFVYMEKYGGSGIALDQQSKTLCLVKPDSPNHVVISHQDLRAAIVLQDGAAIATAVRNIPEAQKALEITLESLGGSHPSKGQPSQPSGAIESIDLKIIYQTPNDSVHTVNFLNMEAKVGGFIYNEAVQQVKMWQDLLSALIHLADQPPKPSPVSAAPPPTLAAASGS